MNITQSYRYEVYNTVSNNVISHPASKDTAQTIADAFNAMNSIDDSYAIRPVVPHTIYKARVNPANPAKPELLEAIAYDLSYTVAHKRAWQMTMALGDDDGGCFYTARLSPEHGPAHGFIRMPWGGLVPDLS